MGEVSFLDEDEQRALFLTTKIVELINSHEVSFEVGFAAVAYCFKKALLDIAKVEGNVAALKIFKEVQTTFLKEIVSKK